MLSTSVLAGNSEPDFPVKSKLETTSFGAPSTFFSITTLAFWVDGVYVIGDVPKLSAGVNPSGTLYPCVGSFGFFGVNSCPLYTGVYPGTYGIVIALKSPGFVGSVGWFG